MRHNAEKTLAHAPASLTEKSRFEHPERSYGRRCVSPLKRELGSLALPDAASLVSFEHCGGASDAITGSGKCGGPSRTRTGTIFLSRDFKSPASAIPPRGHGRGVTQESRVLQGERAGEPERAIVWASALVGRCIWGANCRLIGDGEACATMMGGVHLVEERDGVVLD